MPHRELARCLALAAFAATLLTACSRPIPVVLPEQFKGGSLAQELSRSARAARVRIKILWNESNGPAWWFGGVSTAPPGTRVPTVQRTEAFEELGTALEERFSAEAPMSKMCLVTLSGDQPRAESDAFLRGVGEKASDVTVLSYPPPGNAGRVLAEIDQGGAFRAVVVSVGSSTPEVLAGLEDLPEPPSIRAAVFVTQTSADAMAELVGLDYAIVLDFAGFFSEPASQPPITGDRVPQVTGRLVRY